MKKWMLLALFSLPLLQGCIPLAVAAGAGAAGVVMYDKRPVAVQMRDSDTTLVAQQRLDNDPQLQNITHISVATFNGIVLIVGQAPTKKLREKAYKIVSSVPHIRLIYNEVNIAAPTSSVSRSNDSWITTKVKSAMVAESNLQSTQIKIVTEDGVVYLMGIVTRAQADLAAKTARTVHGVTRVVKAFEYIKQETPQHGDKQ